MGAIEAYPLAWPDGWVRTPAHKRRDSRYEVSFSRATGGVLDAVRLMGGRNVVLSTNIPVRRDGIPYANWRQPDDPGVAVYWDDRKGQSRVIACDCWRKIHENMRALGLTLEALRMVERAGATQILERAYQGFARLPAAADCWQLLGLDGAAIRRAPRESAEAHLRCAHRGLALEHHPDRGGNVETMARINAALDDALREIASW